MSKRFDKLLERATDPSLLEADWELIMSCIDTVRSGEVPVKSALSSVKRRFHSDNPHVSHHALMVLEALVKNCGEKVHKEIATKDFMEELKHLANDSGDKVKDKILELIQCWSYAFREKPEYKIVNDTHNLMKLEGFSFPPLRESDAMFDAEAAPEWVDADRCHRCRAEFGLLTRKHHCRNCGQIFCDKCSSRSISLPHIGIENEVRVCETCFDTIRNKLTTATSTTTTSAKICPKSASSDKIESSTGSTPAAKPSGKSEDEVREEEELQLALAISQSEAEEKERRKQRNLLNKFGTFTNSESSMKEASNDNSMGYTGTMERNSAATDGNESEGELGKYLNRSYWESRRSEQKRGILRNSPTPSAPLAPSEVDQHHENSTDSGKLKNGTHINGTESTDTCPDFREFVDTLRTKIEIFVNRIRNDQARGRSVVTDSGIQSMFVDLTSLHAQLLKHMSDLDDRRGYFESLQDKLMQIKDAREAVDALREEHEQRRQAEIIEMQRQRQIQMAAKLDVMRHKKHEMLEQQRLMVMQRMEEQRREMELRRQMHQQQASMVVGYPGAPFSQYGNVPAQGPPVQHAGSVYGVHQGPVQQYDAYNMQQMAASLPGNPQQQYVPNVQQQIPSMVQQPQYSAVGMQYEQQMPHLQQPIMNPPVQQQYQQPAAPAPQQPFYVQPPVGVISGTQPYASIVYSNQTPQVYPAAAPQQQQSGGTYTQPFPVQLPSMVASVAMPAGVVGPPGTMGSPMHYVHQSYGGPQLSIPQPQFVNQPQMMYTGDPHQQAMNQQQPTPTDAQLISFD